MLESDIRRNIKIWRLINYAIRSTCSQYILVSKLPVKTTIPFCLTNIGVWQRGMIGRNKTCVFSMATMLPIFVRYNRTKSFLSWLPQLYQTVLRFSMALPAVLLPLWKMFCPHITTGKTVSCILAHWGSGTFSFRCFSRNLERRKAAVKHRILQYSRIPCRYEHVSLRWKW